MVLQEFHKVQKITKKDPFSVPTGSECFHGAPVGSMTFQKISWTSETFCKVLVELEDSGRKFERMI